MNTAYTKLIYVLLIGLIPLISGCAQNPEKDSAKKESPANLSNSEKNAVPKDENPVSAEKEFEENSRLETIKPRKNFKAKLVKLNPQELDSLLQKRIKFNTQGIFMNFAGKFAALSALQCDYCLFLTTDSDKIKTTKLVSVYPEFYKPTLQEFLDNVAAQTKATWEHTSDEKKLDSEIKELNLTKDVAAFKLTTTDSTNTYEIDLAPDWKVEDRGMIDSYKPKICPIGLDIYDLGLFSTDDTEDLNKFYQKVKSGVSLQFAEIVTTSKKVTESSVKKANKNKNESSLKK